MSYSRQRGFTIIELMVVMTILGILASLAIPSFTRLMQDNRRTTVANEILANLMSARAEAAKRGLAVTVCGVVDSNNNGVLDDAEKTCSASTDWSDGWMVYRDDNGDGGIAAIGDMMYGYINTVSDLKVNTTIIANGTSAGSITLRAFNQPGTSGFATVCDKRGASEARAVCIETNGRARISTTRCDGTALTCP